MLLISVSALLIHSWNMLRVSVTAGGIPLSNLWLCHYATATLGRHVALLRFCPTDSLERHAGVSVSAGGRPLSNRGYRLRRERSDWSCRHPRMSPSTHSLVAGGDPLAFSRFTCTITTAAHLSTYEAGGHVAHQRLCPTDSLLERATCQRFCRRQTFE